MQLLLLWSWFLRAWWSRSRGQKPNANPSPDPLSLFPLPTTQPPGHRREKGASNKSRLRPPATPRAALYRKFSISPTSSFLGPPSLPSEKALFFNFDRLRECAASDKVRSSLSSCESGHQHSTAPPGSPSAPVTLSPRRKRAIPLHPPTLFPPYTQPRPPTRIPPPERDTGPPI